MAKPAPPGRKKAHGKHVPRQYRRRLVCEALEARWLLSTFAEGEDHPGDGSSLPADAPGTVVAAYGAPNGLSAASSDDTTSPQVLRVDIATTSVSRLDVAFSEDLDVAGMIGDGSIVAAVSLLDTARGALTLRGGQFSYDPATWTLTLVLDQPLPTGTYELRLDGSKLKDLAGNLLRGGRGGLAFEIPTFSPAVTVQANGADLTVDSYSVPSLVDWNDDGLIDLIVGEKTASGEGKVRVYLNSGTNPVPTYQSFSYAQVGAGDLTVPGSGCLGVFPRVFDWDQDGKKDLVLGLADGTLQVALNDRTDADPHFLTPAAVQVGQPGAKTDIRVGARTTLDLVDWNNDGRLDLVLGALDGKVRVFVNAATWGAPDLRSETVVQGGSGELSVPSGRSSVTVVDLNGDGRKDLLLGNTEGQLLFYASVGTDAAPEFNDAVLIQAGGSVIDLSGTPRSRPFVADANKDGTVDLLVGAADGLLRLYAGTRDPAAVVDVKDGDPGAVYTYAFRARAAGSAKPWQCPADPLDVNHDGYITPLDVLVLINYLNDHGNAILPTPPVPPQAPPPYLDCSGDGRITPWDPLLVINDLNASGPHALASGASCTIDPDGNPSCGGEGEAGPRLSRAPARTSARWELEETLAEIAAEVSAMAEQRA